MNNIRYDLYVFTLENGGIYTRAEITDFYNYELLKLKFHEIVLKISTISYKETQKYTLIFVPRLSKICYAGLHDLEDFFAKLTGNFVRRGGSKAISDEIFLFIIDLSLTG